MGRKKIEIDWEEVTGLLSKFCTGSEVASYLNIHSNTLYNRCVEDNGVSFSEYAQSKGELGKIAIKQAQFKSAVEDKNTSMLIWLGKQRLGQSDKLEQTNKEDVRGVDLSMFSEAEKKILLELSLKADNPRHTTSIDVDKWLTENTN